jgi:hypothetical protein
VLLKNARLIRSQGVISHGKVIATLAKAMSRIADLLPRIELQSIIYPTDRMRAAVADLFAYLLQFLIRAQDWYKEGRLRHFIHSITRPVELRYNDLLQQIADSSRLVDQISNSGQQAELRDVHGKIDKIKSTVEEISNAMTCKSAGLSGSVDFRH